jgi:hypothetical protein
MKREHGESYIDFLSRLVGWCENDSNITDDLPSLEAILDFYDLIDNKLGIISPQYLQEHLEENPGKFDAPYNEFINKHKLPWRKCFNGKFEDNYSC